MVIIIFTSTRNYLIDCSVDAIEIISIINMIDRGKDDIYLSMIASWDRNRSVFAALSPSYSPYIAELLLIPDMMELLHDVTITFIPCFIPLEPLDS